MNSIKRQKHAFEERDQATLRSILAQLDYQDSNARNENQFFYLTLLIHKKLF